MSSPHKGVPFGVIGFAAVAGAAALFLVLGPPRDRSTPRPVPLPEAAAVAGNGVTLTTASTELPDDDLTLPAGPGVEAIRANCTGCHSAAMILSQPPLKKEQWQAVVEKMQKAYHAPVNGADVPAIMAYLTSLSAGPTTEPAPPPRSAPMPSRSPPPTS